LSNIARAADSSLRRLQTDHTHRDDPDSDLEETAAAFDALAKAAR